MPEAGATAGGPPTTARPRVLHLLGSFALGGIETWLVHMLRHEREFSVQHEVLLTKSDIGPYEAEVRRLGIPIHRLPIPRGRLKLLRWLPRLRRFLRDQGPFAVVHSHLSLASAVILGAAQTAGVRARFAHCHNARSKGDSFQRPRDKLTRAFAIAALKRTATVRIGISDAAIEEIAGAGWRSDADARVLLYGFDFGKAAGSADRARALRSRLGLDAEGPVIGHVGRFLPVKNHALILEACALLKARAPAAQLILVGEGPELDKVRARVDVLGLSTSVHFPGPTDDVPAFMALFDLMVLPSFSEGLGIVCLEAQVAGTRCLVSENVPPEVAVAPGGVEYLALAAGAEGWAESMERIVAMPPPDPGQWLRLVEESRFGIGRCIRELDAIYLDSIREAA